MLIVGTLVYTITLSALCTFIGLSGTCQNDTPLDGTDESIPNTTTTNTNETRQNCYTTGWVQK